MPTHGEKFKKFSDVQMPDKVRDIVVPTDLLPLVDYSLTMLDAPLIFTFVKRWLNETSFFNLPFCEMKITIDHFFFLFHLPFVGNFFTAPLLIHELACITGDQYLGFTKASVMEEF